MKKIRMGKCYLDTNVLLYLVNDASPSHVECVRLLDGLLKVESIYCVSPLALDEFIYNFGKNIIYPTGRQKRKLIKKALKRILNLPDLQIVNPPVEPVEQLGVIDYMNDYSLKPRDAYHLMTMKSNQIDSFLTFDNDFKKVFEDKALINIREIFIPPSQAQ